MGHKGSSGGSLALLGLMIGAILLIGVAYFLFAGEREAPPTSAKVKIETPKAPTAQAPAPTATATPK